MSMFEDMFGQKAKLTAQIDRAIREMGFHKPGTEEHVKCAESLAYLTTALNTMRLGESLEDIK